MALSATFFAAARFAVPFRLALAIYLTPWVDENVMKKLRTSGTSASTTGAVTAVAGNEEDILA